MRVPGRWLGRRAEHHRQEPGSIKWPGHLAGHPAFSQNSDALTKGFQIFKFVGDQDNTFAFAGHGVQRLEEGFFLVSGDTGCRFIQDENLNAQKQQPENFKLLPFSHGECLQELIGLQAEAH